MAGGENLRAGRPEPFLGGGMAANDHLETYGIDPARIYRKYAPETQRILGLGKSAIEDAIKDGHIPPPLPLTEHGYATGWMGTTLIELQKKRLALAAERFAAARSAAVAPRRRWRRKGGRQQSG
jgi:hypothetical protein